MIPMWFTCVLCAVFVQCICATIFICRCPSSVSSSVRSCHVTRFKYILLYKEIVFRGKGLRYLDYHSGKKYTVRTSTSKIIYIHNRTSSSNVACRMFECANIIWCDVMSDQILSVSPSVDPSVRPSIYLIDWIVFYLFIQNVACFLSL